jgi:hypothetical protein
MVALSAQPGLVEVDLLASGPIVIPVIPAPAEKVPVAESPQIVIPEEPERPLPEVLVAAALAAEDREHRGLARSEAPDARDEPDAEGVDFDSDEFADVVPAARNEYCQQCGAELAPSDIFCGECGFVRRAPDLSVARPRDTATYDPFPWGTPRATDEQGVDEPESASASSEAVDSIPEAVPVATPSPDAVSDSVAPVGATDGDDSVAVDEAQREVGNLELDATGGPSDVEKTRIVDRPARGDAFILQFSTGENITVAGTGLIGRNPLAEPGEYFDSLVSIVDPGKSVSKTHLEFGQDGGQFWISDRYSANGTVVREPDRPARRGEAGKRYRVVRGTRVDIGEQFFIVS